MAQLTPSRSGLSPLRQGARIRLTSHEGEVIKSTRQGATQLAPSRGQSPKTGGETISPFPYDPCGRTSPIKCDHKGRWINRTSFPASLRLYEP